jgi:hypothetical protein
VHQGLGAVAQGQPARQAEVAVEPGVEPRSSVRLQGDDAEALRCDVVVLLETQVGTVGVAADDTERIARQLARLGRPCHERAPANDVVAALPGRPGILLVHTYVSRGVELCGDRAAHVERGG